ncbi:hypothetical protein V1514DRAFT_330065 [Lipomyces japonicus]|uniref:uncharacterized protein n=1 Tax=Lipomyces japonicus TaxID=56871 RepID=UPI0034CE6386
MDLPPIPPRARPATRVFSDSAVLRGPPQPSTLTSISTLSTSPPGYYLHSGAGRTHRRNLALLKNSLTAQYTPVHVPQPRADTRKSYLHALDRRPVDSSSSLSSSSSSSSTSSTSSSLSLSPPASLALSAATVSVVAHSKSSPDLGAHYHGPATDDLPSVRPVTSASGSSNKTIKSSRSFTKLRLLAKKNAGSVSTTAPELPVLPSLEPVTTAATSPDENLSKKSSEVFYTPRSTMTSVHMLTHSPSHSIASSTLSSTSTSTVTQQQQQQQQQQQKQQQQSSKSSIKLSRLVGELVDTELAYLSDLNVVQKYYRQSATTQSFFSKNDIVVIFSSFDAILIFTREFAPNLSSVSNENSMSSIGQLFIEVMPRLEAVYKQYCQSHESSCMNLHRLSSSHAQVARWLESCQKASGSHTNAWNLESLLIKPVQRLLKYPLLLKSIAESTPAGHLDKKLLDQAANEIQAVADRINRVQRQLISSSSSSSDTTAADFKRGGGGGGSSGGGMAVKGLAVRSTEKFKQTVGLSDKTDIVDRSYDILLDRFRRRHMELRIVLESFSSCFGFSSVCVDKLLTLAVAMDDVSKASAVATAATVTKWNSLRHAAADIRDLDLARFRNSVMTRVLRPLEDALDLFDRPQKWMTKRDRKVADYKRFITLRDRGITPDKQTVLLAQSYLSINDTLVKEIPKFLGLVDQMVAAVNANWVDIQARWQYNFARRIRERCADFVDQLLSSSSQQIDEIETGFLLKFSAVEQKLQPLAVANGDMRKLLDTIDLNHQNNTTSAKSSPRLRSISSTPSLVSSSASSPNLASLISPRLKHADFATDSSPPPPLPLPNQQQPSITILHSNKIQASISRSGTSNSSKKKSRSEVATKSSDRAGAAVYGLGIRGAKTK